LIYLFSDIGIFALLLRCRVMCLSRLKLPVSFLSIDTSLQTI